MSSTLLALWLPIIIIGYIIMKYNTLVQLKTAIGWAFADIDVQMKMRFDLIDNLVNTVKGYATHEKDTLESLTKARTSFLSAQSMDEKVAADNQISGALKTIFSVAEAYPDLKANTNFLQLQTDLSDIENKVAASRRYFNSSVGSYNAAIQTFPGNIIAQVFKFTPSEFFAVTNEAEKVVPKVQF